MAGRVVGAVLVVQGDNPRMEAQVPADAEEERWQMEGKDLESVQLFNGATEEKAKPNYSDYLRWREQGPRPMPIRPAFNDPVLEILREAYPEEF